MPLAKPPCLSCFLEQTNWVGRRSCFILFQLFNSTWATWGSLLILFTAWLLGVNDVAMKSLADTRVSPHFSISTSVLAQYHNVICLCLCVYQFKERLASHWPSIMLYECLSGTNPREAVSPILNTYINMFFSAILWKRHQVAEYPRIKSMFTQ